MKKKSRKGIGGRPVIHTEEEVMKMIRVKVIVGVSIKQQCKSGGLRYVSINAAIKRYKLKIPKKFEGKSAMMRDKTN